MEAQHRVKERRHDPLAVDVDDPTDAVQHVQHDVVDCKVEDYRPRALIEWNEHRV